MKSEHWDVVVVGSGAGGAAVAGRLAAGGARVLVVEKGGFARTHSDAMEAVCRYYSDAGLTASVGNCLLPIPTGQTVGGTTTINSATSFKTPEDIIRRWEGSLKGGFSASEFSSFLDQALKALKVKPTPDDKISRSCKLFLAGLKKLGIDTGAPLPRSEDGCQGSGRCCFVCPTGGKMTSYRAFLEPLEGDPRLKLWTNSELASIKPKKKAGSPVRLTIKRHGNGAVLKIECGTLVLSAGSLATPYFIRTFALGPHARIAGDNLTVHPAAKLFAYFDEPVRGWEGVPQSIGTLDPTDPKIRYEGVYTPPELAAITMPLEGSRLAWWMDRYDKVGTIGFMIRDEARGKVRYPAGPRRPLIRYDMTRVDVGRMLRGIRFSAETFLAAGARRVVLPINKDFNEVATPGDIPKAAPDKTSASEFQMMAFHPLGTAAIGRVVDGDLRACPGVFVCDGSVIPESLGVNPQITIYAFALRLADHLLKRKHDAKEVARI